MAGNMLPLLLVAGGAAALMMGKKKKKPAVTPSVVEPVPPSPTFKWDTALAMAQENIQKQAPGTILTKVDSGSMKKNGTLCNWMIASIDPPLSDESVYAGFVICPATQARQEMTGPTVADIKSKIGI